MTELNPIIENTVFLKQYLKNEKTIIDNNIKIKNNNKDINSNQKLNSCSVVFASIFIGIISTLLSVLIFSKSELSENTLYITFNLISLAFCLSFFFVAMFNIDEKNSSYYTKKSHYIFTITALPFGFLIIPFLIKELKKIVYYFKNSAAIKNNLKEENEQLNVEIKRCTFHNKELKKAISKSTFESQLLFQLDGHLDLKIFLKNKTKKEYRDTLTKKSSYTYDNIDIQLEKIKPKKIQNF